MDLFSTLLALAAASSPAPPAPPAPSCEAPPALPAPAPPARSIRADTVRVWLNTMLQAEGLTQVTAAQPILRRVELDSDVRTEEALVDIIAPEHCDALGQCQTLIVRALPCGRLVALGHGRGLTPLDSRTAGWLDLGETHRTLLLPPVVLRALHWRGARYGG